MLRHQTFVWHCPTVGQNHLQEWSVWGSGGLLAASW
jgi:hypothetical protein